jgi:hypothetical protein
MLRWLYFAVSGNRNGFKNVVIVKSISEERMLGCTIGVPRRGIAACFACITLGGAALAQDMLPLPAPPTVAATPVPNAAAAPPAPDTVAVPPTTPAATPPAQLLTQGQLDQLVAPIALYPDPLLAQILMASTYPLEVVEAARWVGAPANKALKGEALATALQAQSWDPSIGALVPFPRVLENMSDQLQWTEQLGNAFLAQQADIMAAVQRLRHQAMAAGNLKQTPQCRCVIQTSGETISIMPAEPQTVCVPIYRPVVYGAWPDPAYPPVSFPDPIGFAYAPGFWIGFDPPIVLASFGPLWGWGWVDWGHRYIAVDPGRYALATGGHVSFAGNVWVHDAAHRGGIAYADPVTRGRFDAGRVSALAGAAHSSAGRNAAAVHGVGRFGGAAIHGGAAASHGDAAFHGMPAFHGATAFRSGAGFHGAPAAHGRVGSRAGPSAFHGGPHGSGAPHFAMGAPHGGGGPHGGSPHGGGPGGHHG